MTTPNTNKNENTSPSTKPYLNVPLLAILGVMITGLIVGAAILWEKRFESWVGVDLPHEDQDTSETSSIIPYICDQDPEACKNSPLTFRGQDHDSHKPDDLSVDEKQMAPPPSISSPAMEEMGNLMNAFLNLPLLQELEAKIEAVDQIPQIKMQIETLSILAILDNVQAGRVNYALLVNALENCHSPRLNHMATQLPSSGYVIPFSELTIYEVTPQAPDSNPSTWGRAMEDLKDWVYSLVEIKTEADIQVTQRVDTFKDAAIQGKFDNAFQAYQAMDEKQRQSYGDWILEIKNRKKLSILNTLLLQKLAEEL